MGAVAKKESDDKSRRIRRKHQEIAAAGSCPAGDATLRVRVRPPHDPPRRSGGDPRVRRRVLAGDPSARSACDLNERGDRTVTGGGGRRRPCGGCCSRHGSAASASTTARSSRRRVAGDLTPAETQRIRAQVRRPRPAHEQEPLAAICSPGCCAAATAARRSSPARGRRHPPLRVRERPGLRWLRQDHDHRRARWSTSIIEAVLSGSTSPELAASLQGRKRRPRCGASGRPRSSARRRSWTSSRPRYGPSS